MSVHKLTAGFGVVLAINFLAVAAAAQTYTFKTFKAPMSGSTIFEATDNGGAVVSQVSASGSTNCSLNQGGVKIAIADPNAPVGTTTCLGVGNGKVVVGYYQAPGQPAGASAGFSYQNGTYTDFVVPSANVQMGGTQLEAISSNGLFAGTYSDDKGHQHVFKSRGSTTSLENVTIPYQSYLIAVGVNDNGVTIVQNFGGKGETYTGSFYLHAGTPATQIIYPNSTQTVCHGVNNAGDVACHYADAQGLQHGFIYHGATNSYSANIDAPTSTGGTLLFGIDDAGRVVGTTTPNPQTSIRLGLIGTPSSN